MGTAVRTASESGKGHFRGTQSGREASLEEVVLQLGPQGARTGRAGEDAGSFRLGGSVDRAQRTH